MNKPISDKRISQFCQSLDETNALHQQDENLSPLYKDMITHLRTLPISYHNEHQLSERLAKEMKSKAGLWARMDQLFNAIPQPIFASSTVLLLMILIIGFLSAVHVPGTIKHIVFEAQTPAGHQTPNFLWQHRLQQGKIVTIPEFTKAKIKLNDGSILHASPQSRLAIRFIKNKRNIDLHSGALKVNAAPIPNSTMIVHTPIIDITVIGTTFHIELNP